MSLLNKRFVLAAVLFGVTASVTIYEAGEIDAGEYRVLRDGFKRGTPAYQAAIAQAMHNGEISRWEYRHLLGQYRNRRTMLLIDNDATNLREERLVLTAMTRQVKHR
jgi:hypothetical protein